MRKLLLTLILLAVTAVSHAQIVIDQAGDNWRAKVDSAIALIKTAPKEYYENLESSCDSISFFNASFSSCSGGLMQKGTIFVSANDVKIGIQNIAAVLIHESLHLRYRKNGLILSERREESYCYLYEWRFLRSLPEPDPALLDHAAKQMREFAK